MVCAYILSALYSAHAHSSERMQRLRFPSPASTSPHQPFGLSTKQVLLRQARPLGASLRARHVSSSDCRTGWRMGTCPLQPALLCWQSLPKMESWKKDGMLCLGQGALRAGCSLQHTWETTVQLYKVVNNLPFLSRKLLASICVSLYHLLHLNVFHIKYLSEFKTRTNTCNNCIRLYH